MKAFLKKLTGWAKVHPKVRAVAIAVVLAVIGTIGGNLAGLGITGTEGALLTAVLGVVAGYLRKA
jgi:hypothetical protein